MALSKRVDQTQKKPAMTSSHQDATACQWFSRLASALDRRSAPGLVRIFLGAILARGRRTVTSSIRAARLNRAKSPAMPPVRPGSLRTPVK